MAKEARSPGRSTTASQGRRARPSREAVESAIRTLISWMGDDAGRAGVEATPSRVAHSLKRLTNAGGTSLRHLLHEGVFRHDDDGLILIRDVEFYSLCEHHLLPFFGRVHVAYLPVGRIIGFSRIPRLVEHFARRLQVQERLTSQVATALEQAVSPAGAACMVEAFHLCMAMRGVEKQQATAVTWSYRGVFREEVERRRDLEVLIGAGRPLRP
ncbi:MAG: GTP cyclohydrolase I FolE [Acidobacteriota bacterium]